MRCLTMRNLLGVFTLVLTLGTNTTFGQPTAGTRNVVVQPKGSQRWALLIGVDDYVVAKKLDYCGADMRALKDQLVASGFPEKQVFLLHDQAPETRYRPMKANIQRQLELVLGLVQKGDLIVLGFSGHGVHLDGKSYLCPGEAQVDRPTTLVSLDEVYDRLQKCPASFKLLLVDACRNDPRRDGEKTLKATEGTKQFARTLERPPEGIMLLTSCAAGQISREDAALGHGIFMHYVLEGLRGKVAAQHNGRVSLLGLADYASHETKVYVSNKFNVLQTPALKGDFSDFEFVSPSVNVITNTLGAKMVLLPAGEFDMGSPDSDKDAFSSEKPQHRVRINKPFYLGAHEVSIGQFRQFVSDSGYKTDAEQDGKGGYGLEGTTWVQKPDYSWRKSGFQQTDEHPVVNVSWNDADAFCKWLSRKEGKAYSLPTEAQWEYACRAGSTTKYCYGDGEAELGDYAWFLENSGMSTHPVGSKKPNRWGLYDMHGNAWEWCADWYDDKYYGESLAGDPAGPSSGTSRVLRGGSWGYSPFFNRSANRFWYTPANRYYSTGFRVSRTP